MTSSEKESDQVMFKYIFADDYNPVYVTGAHGGVTPTGDIVVNFYLERQGLPESQTFAIGPDGTILREVKRTPQESPRNYVRFVQTGVVLRVQRARELVDWLQKKVEDAEQVEERSNRGGGAKPEADE